MDENITLTIREGITFDRFTEMMQQLVAEKGCAGCGFNGWDFNLRINPAEQFIDLREKFRGDLVGIDVLGKAALPGGLQAGGLPGGGA